MRTWTATAAAADMRLTSIVKHNDAHLHSNAYQHHAEKTRRHLPYSIPRYQINLT